MKSPNLTSKSKLQFVAPQLPKGGGALSGVSDSFQTTAFSGASSLTVPLPVSPCRGFEPSLRLEYDSGAGNGPFGAGFKLSLSQISRSLTRRIPSYTDADTFTLSGAGDLIRKLEPLGNGWEVVTRIVTDGHADWSVAEYRPRVEQEFARIEQWVRQSDGDVYWQVTDRNNVIHVFGKDPHARIVDPENRKGILTWLLESSADAKGNQILYSYRAENDESVPDSISDVGHDNKAQRYLDKVRYGPYQDPSTGEQRWHFEMVFDYGERGFNDEGMIRDEPLAPWPVRQDRFSTYRPGFEVRTYRLCHAVLLYHRFTDLTGGSPVLISALRFRYLQTPRMSFLQAVDEIGFRLDREQKIEFTRVPPLELSYSRSDPTFLFSLGAEFADGLQTGPAPEVLRIEFALNDAPLSTASEITSIAQGKWIVNDGDRSYVIERNSQADDLDQTGSQSGAPARLDVFQPDRMPKFEPLVIDGGAMPGLIDQGGYRMVDLDGEGLPGMFYADEATVLYWKPRGGGVLEAPSAPANFPLARIQESGESFLSDVAANGLLDLEVRAQAASGVYPRKPDSSWGEFQPYENFPTDAADPIFYPVDTTGDGRSDLLVAQEQLLKVYRSKGYRGYAAAEFRGKPPGLPLDTAPSQREVVRFADVFGDGGSHLIRIRNGAIQCWPNLGHGQFGVQVDLAGAPHFDGELDPDRLFLADIDGSGTADLIYVEHERLLIYFNDSGNGFSASPCVVPLPASWDSIADLQFADVLGNGTACAVLTTVDEDLKANHRYFDFTGGVKPHLLIEVDNNLGALTRIKYAPSTKFYLEDRKAGRPWVTRLAFPIQVVEKVETIDQIADSRHVHSFRYHDGYYDPVEREFRGFGMVENWDTERFDFPQQAERASRPEQSGLLVAPTYTKTWYQTGAFFESEQINRQYRAEYFQGDPDALVLDSAVLGEGMVNAGAETLREAYAALQGSQIREEVYGLDVGEGADPAVPYSVSQSTFHVRLLQPRAQQKYAGFYVHERESLTYNYERNASDPRTTHNFTIEVDPWGNVRRACQINYLRRQNIKPLSPNPADHVHPEQTLLRALATVDRYINQPDHFYLLGLPLETQSFELLGLTPGENGYFTFAQIAQQVNQALDNVISISKSDGPSARLLTWVRQYYVDTASTIIPLVEPLPFGQVSAQALLHSAPSAVFSAWQIEQVYGPKLSEAQTVSAGYFLDQNSQYWWNPNVSSGYGSAEQFYLPVITTDPFGATTTVGYDQYYLAVTQLTDAMGNRTRAEIDYQTLNLLPRRVLDPNNNISEVLFDPLGLVIATSVQGKVGDKGVGDAPLADYETTVGQLPVIHTPLTEIVKQPRRYLQKATSFFAYDLFAWRLRRQPLRFFSISRMIHVSEERNSEAVELLQTLGYFDGFGRTLQTKQKTPPGAAWTINSSNSTTEIITDDRWLTTGRTVYNNKGAPVKQYEPYFTDSPEYAPEAVISEFGVTPIYQYDSLLRLVRTDLPAGYFTKTVRTAWVETNYDADDTILESAYFANRANLTPDELAALGKAVVFADTPNQTVVDNMGRSFLLVEMQTRSKESTLAHDPGRTPIRYLSTHNDLDIQGNVIVSTDPRLHRLNERAQASTANFQNVYDMNGNLLFTSSVDAGKRWVFRNVMGSTLCNWDGRGFCIETQYDALQRKKQVLVQGDDGRGLSLNQVVEYINYGDEPEYADSQQSNQRGRPVEYYDQAGRLQYLLYGIAGELLESSRQFRIGYVNEADWTVVNGQVVTKDQLEPEAYTLTWNYDALGRLINETAPDGSSLNDDTEFFYQYHPQGWLSRVEVKQSGGPSQPFVKETIYNARAQRTQIVYGNDVTTSYEYDPKTFLLTRIQTHRKNVPDAAPAGSKYLLQDINYTYDPVGNITLVSFAGQQPVIHDGQLVEPRATYTYNSLYRLIESKGREHPGLSAHAGAGAEQYLRPAVTPLNDAEKLTHYTRRFHYDEAGNLRWVRHLTKDTTRCFTRQMQVEGPANQPPAVPSNRLSRVCTNAAMNALSTSDVTPARRICESVDYDANGNMETLEGNRQVYWNYRNNISHVPTVARRDANPNDGDYYIYNFSGQRVRRVTQRLRDGKSGLIEIEEKLYFGTLEILRRWFVSPESANRKELELERKSLQVRESADRIAIVHHWTVKPASSRDGKVPDEQVRYQLQDNLGSVMLELDNAAGVLTYEEYFPYGGTSLMWGRNKLDSSLKEYRYAGKERDDSTGLYYYGARYYAPWLCRWLSPDPAWTIDGLNLYAFVGGNPIAFSDQTGTAKGKKGSSKKKGPKIKPVFSKKSGGPKTVKVRVEKPLTTSTRKWLEEKNPDTLKAFLGRSKRGSIPVSTTLKLIANRLKGTGSNTPEAAALTFAFEFQDKLLGTNAVKSALEGGRSKKLGLLAFGASQNHILSDFAIRHIAYGIKGVMSASTPKPEQVSALKGFVGALTGADTDLAESVMEDFDNNLGKAISSLSNSAANMRIGGASANSTVAEKFDPETDAQGNVTGRSQEIRDAVFTLARTGLISLGMAMDATSVLRVGDEAGTSSTPVDPDCPRFTYTLANRS